MCRTSGWSWFEGVSLRGAETADWRTFSDNPWPLFDKLLMQRDFMGENYVASVFAAAWCDGVEAPQAIKYQM
jgi:hypothetical protein